ncbi:unnamed protein product [Colias eurytheme]|nr:unnamed protein product [Colias eurytheme]
MKLMNHSMKPYPPLPSPLANIDNTLDSMVSSEHSQDIFTQQVFSNTQQDLAADDLAFFASLGPILKSFDVGQKLEFRSRVLREATNIRNWNRPNSSNSCERETKISLIKMKLAQIIAEQELAEIDESTRVSHTYTNSSTPSIFSDDGNYSNTYNTSAPNILDLINNSNTEMTSSAATATLNFSNYADYSNTPNTS